MNRGKGTSKKKKKKKSDRTRIRQPAAHPARQHRSPVQAFEQIDKPRRVAFFTPGLESLNDSASVFVLDGSFSIARTSILHYSIQRRNLDTTSRQVRTLPGLNHHRHPEANLLFGLRRFGRQSDLVRHIERGLFTAHTPTGPPVLCSILPRGR